MYEGTDERAPEARCGATTTLGGAFPPMACTLPAGHAGAHDADSAVPIPQPREALREAVAEELWRERWNVMPWDRAKRDDIWYMQVRDSYRFADRILALLSERPDAPGGEREPVSVSGRGLATWAQIEDLDGTRVDVQDSSLATEPALRICVRDDEPLPCAHLSVEQATEVRDAINAWLAALRFTAPPETL